MWGESVLGVFYHIEVPQDDVRWWDEAVFCCGSDVFPEVRIFRGEFGAYTESRFICEFSGHSIVKLIALPGVISMLLHCTNFILFRFITITIPFERGFSLS